MRTNGYHHVIATAGTSVFAPANILGKLSREGQWFRFDRANPLPWSENEDRACGWERAVSGLTKKPPPDPTAVSAEFSLVHALCRAGRLRKVARIDLIHTATYAGRLAAWAVARALETWLPAELSVSLCPVPDIDVRDRGLLARGLAAYLSALANRFRWADPSGTCFAPLGGYKVMTGYGYLVGALYGYPSVYLHEEGQEVLHEIPALPLKVAPERLADGMPLLARANRQGPLLWEMLSPEEQRWITENTWLFERVENLLELNALGLFVLTTPDFAVCREPAILFSEDARKAWKGLDTRERRALWAQLLQIPLKYRNDREGSSGELFHELTFQGLEQGSLRFHVYKPGSVPQRIAWAYDEDRDELRVNRIWLDHDRYEREAPEGKGLSRDLGSFAAVEPPAGAGR